MAVGKAHRPGAATAEVPAANIASAPSACDKRLQCRVSFQPVRGAGGHELAGWHGSTDRGTPELADRSGRTGARTQRRRADLRRAAQYSAAGQPAAPGPRRRVLGGHLRQRQFTGRHRRRGPRAWRDGPARALHPAHRSARPCRCLLGRHAGERGALRRGARRRPPARRGAAAGHAGAPARRQGRSRGGKPAPGRRLGCRTVGGPFGDEPVRRRAGAAAAADQADRSDERIFHAAPGCA